MENLSLVKRESCPNKSPLTLRVFIGSAKAGRWLCV
ncbi:DUF1493 family protein [Mixta gaviniae]